MDPKFNFSPEKGTSLSQEQITMLLSFTRRFGKPDSGGMISIPTGTKMPEPGPAGLRGKETQLLREDEERSIWIAKEAGILVNVRDCRLPEAGDASESMSPPSPYNPEAGFTIEFSKEAIDYLAKL